MDLDSKVIGKKAGFGDEILMKAINISYKFHITNEEVLREIQTANEEYKDSWLCTKKEN